MSTDTKMFRGWPAEALEFYEGLEALRAGISTMAGVAEVAAGDELAIGVGGEPRATASHELVHLLGPHPVVLVIVEDGAQHEEVLEKVLHPMRAREGHVRYRLSPQPGNWRSRGTVVAATS